ncbi:hypothetical protein B0H63DRAFT_519602 [Podospora didyma]|uniref:Zn(2)-C6 fungal-type domain-containing protein n=1 Tax=Podospora didyma TaxID=330526 RepID=A0AAE0NZQ1_9PEZI|nr:hypothetical protein B0H63DRAFT_519602 [Podospora didyma]
MQAISHRDDHSRISLGHRRGVSDLARFALDLTWARADSESAARLRSYPSPPMSGSPPLPPKVSQEVAERSQGTYQATTQDAYRGIPATQGEERAQTGAPLPPRSFLLEGPERMYAFHRSEMPVTRPLSYHQQHTQLAPQPAYLLAPGAGAGLGSGPGAGVGAGPGVTAGPLPTPHYAAASHHPIQESHQTSPKPQRKTKGHVASACVPCKKAHLRCDARRPCSRCEQNGKQDACIDVQHRKRGRPRLRDDRETKFDVARYGPASDPMRRPMPSMYGQGAPMGMGYDDNLRRTQSYRVLKSQPAEPIAPRYPERGSASDANVYPAPLSISTRAPEPAAILTLGLDLAKASSTFWDAVGRQPMEGLRLADLLVSGDREKVSALQRQMHDEQKRKDPTYLPPIFGRETEVRVMQALGFTSEELGRYAFDWQEYLTFLSPDGQQRQFPLRLGLAKQDSIYFVVLWLTTLPARHFQYLTPSPNPRDMTYSYQLLQQPYSQPTPVSATFDPRQSRLGDSGYGARQGAPPGAASQMIAGLSPGHPSSYASSPSRSEYTVAPPPYQLPRNELHTAGRPSQTPGYQLPPIRNPQPVTSQHQELSYLSRDDRSRVDIGGLLDRPGPPQNKQHQH